MISRGLYTNLIIPKSPSPQDLALDTQLALSWGYTFLDAVFIPSACNNQENPTRMFQRSPEKDLDMERGIRFMNRQLATAKTALKVWGKYTNGA